MLHILANVVLKVSGNVLFGVRTVDSTHTSEIVIVWYDILNIAIVSKLPLSESKQSNIQTLKLTYTLNVYRRKYQNN